MDDPRTHPPPREVRTLRQMARFHMGWNAGGLANQPALLMRRLALAESVEAAWYMFKTMKWAKMMTEHRAEWRFANQIRVLLAEANDGRP